MLTLVDAGHTVSLALDALAHPCLVSLLELWRR